jgi:hypothetical protein
MSLKSGASVRLIEPSALRVKMDARSKRNPSTPMSCAQCRTLSMIILRTAAFAQLSVLPVPEKLA